MDWRGDRKATCGRESEDEDRLDYAKRPGPLYPPPLLGSEPTSELGTDVLINLP